MLQSFHHHECEQCISLLHRPKSYNVSPVYTCVTDACLAWWPQQEETDCQLVDVLPGANAGDAKAIMQSNCQTHASHGKQHGGKDSFQLLEQCTPTVLLMLFCRHQVGFWACARSAAANLQEMAAWPSKHFTIDATVWQLQSSNTGLDNMSPMLERQDH